MGIIKQIGKLRWLKLDYDGDYGDQKDLQAMRLQEAWQDQQTGAVIWLDVPLVLEKTGQDARGKPTVYLKNEPE